MGAILVEELALGTGETAVAVKDSIAVAGYPTRVGSRALADAPPAAAHAAVVQALLDAGCRIIGKANMHELAYGVTGINGWTGTPVNPRYPDRVPGGSSSGSAVAVAAGLCDFALGTDTGGSIRIPATCCGLYGLKPTFGRISRDGVLPADSSLDCVGPLARSLAMIERAMALLDPAFHAEAAVVRPRIGVVAVTADAPVAKPVAQAVAARLAVAPVEQVPVALPGMGAAYDAGLAIIAAENWRAFGHLARSPLLGADVGERLRAAEAVTAEQLARAEVVRAAFTAEVDAALDRVDALVLPTMPGLPLTLAAAVDARATIGSTAFVRPFNLSGHPALSIPLETPDGLPAGLQIIGRRGDDARLCAVARALDIVTEQSGGTGQ
ncbi:amidase [Sphingomonas flavalba]|uniref:amidase n=1 Tax=Sphingomonas flavalba TaxID=2559804 RepID=UPI0039E00C2C